MCMYSEYRLILAARHSVVRRSSPRVRAKTYLNFAAYGVVTSGQLIDAKSNGSDGRFHHVLPQTPPNVLLEEKANATLTAAINTGNILHFMMRTSSQI